MRKHNRKIYYSTGLISIILLPILCILYLKNNDAITHYGVISFQTWDGKENPSNGNKGITQFLNSRKFTTVMVTGDNDADKAKLDRVQKSIRGLVLSKDTINGIKFHFGQKSEYWTYVRVLDILAIEKAKVYIPYKNVIWVVNPRIPKPNKNLKHVKHFICGYKPNDINEEETQIKWIKIKEFVEKYYLPVIAYLLMVFFTIKKLMQK